MRRVSKLLTRSFGLSNICLLLSATKSSTQVWTLTSSYPKWAERWKKEQKPTCQQRCVLWLAHQTRRGRGEITRWTAEIITSCPPGSWWSERSRSTSSSRLASTTTTCTEPVYSPSRRSLTRWVPTTGGAAEFLLHQPFFNTFLICIFPSAINNLLIFALSSSFYLTIFSTHIYRSIMYIYLSIHISI